MEINNLSANTANGNNSFNCPKISLSPSLSLSDTHTHTYQVIWRESRAQSLAHIPVWLRWRPTVSQGGRGSAGRCCHQLMRFPWLQECGWRRAVWWLLPGAGECWHRSGEPSESPLWSDRVFTERVYIYLRVNAEKITTDIKHSGVIITAVLNTVIYCNWVLLRFQALCLQSTKTAFHIPANHKETAVWPFPGLLPTAFPLWNNGPFPSLKEGLGPEGKSNCTNKHLH